MPYLYYAGYTAFIEKGNGDRLKLDISESDIGFVEVECKEKLENVKLEVFYKTPISYIVCYIISAVSTCIFIIYIIYEKKLANR